MIDLTKAAALLQSSDAAGLLLAALTGSPDGEVPGFRAELTTWQYRPGAEVTAGYQITHHAGQGEVTDHLFATTAPATAIDTSPTATVSHKDKVFRVWRHPHDPRLPGLARACDPDRVLGWLSQTTSTLHLNLLAYRPLRRAVLSATTDVGTTYLKVLRPDRVEHLAVRQNLLDAAGLTTPIVAQPTPGVLLTPAARGKSLAQVLAGPGTIPDAEALVGLLDRLPTSVNALKWRPAWAERLDFHSATATARLPESAEEIRVLTSGLQAVLDTTPVGPVVPTHGDFYEANIFVDGDQLSLIDLDNVGPGLREDDLGCLLGHLAVLPTLSPEHFQRVPQIVADWTDHFTGLVNPAALFARVSAVLLSLVASGVGDQAALRLELAQDWAARSMREPSSASSRASK